MHPSFSSALNALGGGGFSLAKRPKEPKDLALARKHPFAFSLKLLWKIPAGHKAPREEVGVPSVLRQEAVWIPAMVILGWRRTLPQQVRPGSVGRCPSPFWVSSHPRSLSFSQMAQKGGESLQPLALPPSPARWGLCLPRTLSHGAVPGLRATTAGENTRARVPGSVLFPPELTLSRQRGCRAQTRP